MASILTGNFGDFMKIGVGAASRGDLETLMQVLDEKPPWRTRVGSHGRTMLWEAAYRGRLNVVEYLLDTFNDVDIEARGCHYTPLLVEISPLCAAIYKKRQTVIARLERAGAVYDALTATFLGDMEKVSSMIAEKPSLVTEEFYQHDPHFDATLMHYAVSGNHQHVVELLLEKGAKVKPYSNHLLDFALGRGNVATVRSLLEAGVDATQKTYLRGDIDNDELVHLLREFGATIEIDASDNGWPSLVYVCRGDQGGNPDAVRKLLEQGADVNIRNYKGQSALHCAAKAGFVEPVEILLAHSADVDAQDRDGDTPLHAACKSTIKDQRKLQRVIEHLKAAGANPGIANNKGRTAQQSLRRKSELQL